MKSKLDEIFKPLKVVQDATIGDQFEKLIEEVDELTYAVECEGGVRKCYEALDVMQAAKGLLDQLEAKGFNVSKIIEDWSKGVYSRYEVRGK